MGRGSRITGYRQHPSTPCPYSGSEVRVLLFNATGDRDTAALLKLLLVRFWGACGGGAVLGPHFAAGAGSHMVEVLSICPSIRLSFCPVVSQLNAPLLCKGFTAPAAVLTLPPSPAGLGQVLVASW